MRKTYNVLGGRWEGIFTTAAEHADLEGHDGMTLPRERRILVDKTAHRGIREDTERHELAHAVCSQLNADTTLCALGLTPKQAEDVEEYFVGTVLRAVREVLRANGVKL